MDKISNSLLEPDIMRRLTQHWLHSDVGLMYVAVSEEVKEVKACFKDFGLKEQKVLWGCTLDKDAVYALHTMNEGEDLKTVLHEAPSVCVVIWNRLLALIK